MGSFAVLLVLVTLLAVLLAPALAFADTSDLPDGSNWGWVNGALGGTLLGTGSGASPQDTESCTFDPNFPNDVPTVPDIAFKTFQPIGGGTASLLLDEYDPAVLGLVKFPALVLVHGGGFKSGCRRGINHEAYFLSHDSSIAQFKLFHVFASDYRLTCTSSPDPYLNSLCGWNYPTIDPLTGSNEAAIKDVRDAVAWVRPVWGPAHSSAWNGKVYAVGASSGGNLVFMAAARSTTGSPDRPDAIGGWSAGPEFQKVQPENQYGCDITGHTDCWIARNRYLGCGPTIGEQQQCLSLYTTASPISSGNYAAGDPPAFTANGGTGTDGPELIAWQESRDFAVRLNNVLLVTAQECRVDVAKHATTYLYNYSCEGVTGLTVIQSTVSFLLQH